ncbi:hypothetical protein C8R44DRAFT_881916 [Mycena epipterygia]|nr:hypothetical protein C8R44DRAFT_881916 [Mycena epipterygia]
MVSWNRILGLSSVAAATVLLGLVAFDVPYFKSVYFLRIDLGNGTATAAANQTNPFVDLGALGFCTNLKDGRGLQCSPLQMAYTYSLVSGGLEIPQWNPPPSSGHGRQCRCIDTYEGPGAALVAFGIAVMSLAFALLSFLGVPIADCCSSCFCGFAGAAAFAVFAFDIAFFEIIKLRVNQEGHSGTALMGNAVYLTLFAWLLLFVTPILFLIGRCCGCCIPKPKF